MQNLTDKQHQIKTLIAAVLNENPSGGRLKLMTQEIYHLMETTVSLGDGVNSRSSTGLCLTPINAANCMLGYRRTLAYWRALLLALESFSSEQPITLVYPGCGPLATLVLPILFSVYPHKVNITFIDYHQSALDHLQRQILTMDNAQIECRFICADATQWLPDSDIDILILECMLKGLDDEGHVSIVNHFAPFLTPDASLIPEEIEVKAMWIDMSAEAAYCQAQHDGGKLPKAEQLKQYRVPICDVFKLERDTYQKVDDNQIPCVDLVWVNQPGSNYHFSLTMRLKLLNNIWLEEYADGITMPFFPELIKNSDNEIFSNLSGYYQLGGKPGFVFNVD